MGRASVAAVVCTALVPAASAATTTDSFGSGANQFDIDFVTIPANPGQTRSTNTNGDTVETFTAGAGLNDYTDPGNAYRIGVYEITKDQWDKFKAELSVAVDGSPAGAYNDSPAHTGANVPTNNVSWYEAAQFVNWLNTSTGHQPAYKFTGTQGTGSYTLDKWSPAEADNGTNLYRHKDAFYYLPTEDEWVKAAYWDGTDLQKDANAAPGDLVSGEPDPTKWNYTPSAAPWNVGSGAEELNGTYDMMGNVWEWMESPGSDSSFGTGSDRGRRGGSIFNGEGALESSRRLVIAPDNEASGFGFRVASEIPEPASLSLLAVGALALIKRRR